MSGARVRVQGGFFEDNAFGKILKQGGQNFLVGITTNGTVTLGMQMIQYEQHRGDPNAPTLATRVQTAEKNSLYGGLFMGISSNLRYAAYSWLQNNISHYVASQPTAKIILTGASFGNNLFGGWSFVKIAKAVGVMKNGATPAKPSDPDITALTLEDLGGAYYRVQGDDTAASYMFDFLRSGEQAGPAPVIQ